MAAQHIDRTAKYPHLANAKLKDLLETLIDEMVETGILWEEALGQFEKKFIQKVLDKNRNNLSRSAHMMGIHRNTISRKMGEYKIK